MRYWIFKTNPEKYELERRLQNPLRLVTWKVNEQYRTTVGIGDVAFIFRTGSKRAIVGKLRVTSDVCRMEEIETERPYCAEPDSGIELRVLAEITHRCARPITAGELRATGGLERLSILDPGVFQMATTFPVSETEASVLAHMVSSR